MTSKFYLTQAIMGKKLRGVLQFVLITVAGCSSQPGPIVVPTPLENATVELRQTIQAKQDELDVAADMIQQGRAQFVRQALFTSMDDIVPLVEKLASAASGTEVQSDVESIAKDAKELPKLARKGDPPHALQQRVVTIENQLASLEERVKQL